MTFDCRFPVNEYTADGHRQDDVRQAQKALGQSEKKRRISEAKFQRVFGSNPLAFPIVCQDRFHEKIWGTGFEGRPKAAGREPTEADP